MNIINNYAPTRNHHHKRHDVHHYHHHHHCHQQTFAMCLSHVGNGWEIVYEDGLPVTLALTQRSSTNGDKNHALRLQTRNVNTRGVTQKLQLRALTQNANAQSILPTITGHHAKATKTGLAQKRTNTRDVPQSTDYHRKTPNAVPDPKSQYTGYYP